MPATLVDEALAARPALASGARLLALRAWLRSLDGDEAGALADVTRAWEDAGDGTRHLLRRERPRLEPLLWTALERGVLAPERVVEALDAARPGGTAALALTRHPAPDVRRTAVLAAVASGHPRAVARADELQADPDPAVARRRCEVAAEDRAAAARVHRVGRLPPAAWRVRDR